MCDANMKDKNRDMGENFAIVAEVGVEVAAAPRSVETSPSWGALGLKVPLQARLRDRDQFWI